MLESNCLSQTTSITASAKAIYSASALDSATAFCFLHFQETTAEPRKITKPEYYDFLLLGCRNLSKQ